MHRKEDQGQYERTPYLCYKTGRDGEAKEKNAGLQKLSKPLKEWQC